VPGVERDLPPGKTRQALRAAARRARHHVEVSELRQEAAAGPVPRPEHFQAIAAQDR